jgi:hypothetical protein
MSELNLKEFCDKLVTISAASQSEDRIFIIDYVGFLRDLTGKGMYYLAQMLDIHNDIMYPMVDFESMKNSIAMRESNQEEKEQWYCKFIDELYIRYSPLASCIEDEFCLTKEKAANEFVVAFDREKDTMYVAWFDGEKLQYPLSLETKELVDDIIVGESIKIFSFADEHLIKYRAFKLGETL